ncbi:MAG: UDP-N-acetylmuramate:L-alanyl-gamma-D-glutamyl-meso-diaminopimelate ligase [Gammaproteobacteria bacterium]|nr:UDP-N-acetylmuramate:L-alanyl-gamma-D-glutamyl-meso-diaminopimelate ligase [Gammaproteobacteria bacterium]
MRVHIAGIGGVFMAGIALLAKELGLQVSGCDGEVYPPVSDLLAAHNITVTRGCDPAQLRPPPDQLIIGNALSRGNPLVEAALDAGLTLTSGPQWLAENILTGRRVIAVAGTHGKTTTTAMLVWILQRAGLAPGFLIGGMPGNFSASARIGGGEWFVVEADEYDSAFFDKRPKFVHYRPRIAVLLNLEFDHADIYDNLGDIQKQFHYLLRTVPAAGTVVVNRFSKTLPEVLRMGCWSTVQQFAVDGGDGGDGIGDFTVHGHRVHCQLSGAHNRENAAAAVTAAKAIGITTADAAAALADFRAPRRRMEDLGVHRGIRVVDDFAHHPTAIARTLAAARAVHLGSGGGRLIAVFEPRSNSMRLGVHRDALPAAFTAADHAFLLWPGEPPAGFPCPLHTAAASSPLLAALQACARPGDCVVFMSNGGFDGVQQKFIARLSGDVV